MSCSREKKWFKSNVHRRTWMSEKCNLPSVSMKISFKWSNVYDSLTGRVHYVNLKCRASTKINLTSCKNAEKQPELTNYIMFLHARLDLVNYRLFRSTLPGNEFGASESVAQNPAHTHNTQFDTTSTAHGDISIRDHATSCSAAVRQVLPGSPLWRRSKEEWVKERSTRGQRVRDQSSLVTKTQPREAQCQKHSSKLGF